MTDPRNVAHDKRVKREKKHQGDAHSGTAAADRPGMKPPLPGRGPDANESIESIDQPESVERH